MGLPKIQGEIARLWKAPELRFTPAGKAVCDLPLVFNKRIKDESGTWQDAGSMFVRATVWDKAAEHCGEALDKGDDVIVTGELSVREFERKDGSKGQSLELRVYEIGASLKWNGVKIVRAERGSGSSPSKPSDDPWSSSPDSEMAPF